MRVVPEASAPSISARCDIDLSPGTRMRPLSGPPARALKGRGARTVWEVTLRSGSSAADPLRHGGWPA